MHAKWQPIWLACESVMAAPHCVHRQRMQHATLLPWLPLCGVTRASSSPSLPRQARENVAALPWVMAVDVRMDARPAAPLLPDDSRPNGLRKVAHVIAVSSCKGGAPLWGAAASGPAVVCSAVHGVPPLC